jgi:CMP-N-acetylneuraminic acid synthetase
MATQFILGNKCRPIIIDSIEGFDINTEIDFLIAEALMQYLKE